MDTRVATYTDLMPGAPDLHELMRAEREREEHAVPPEPEHPRAPEPEAPRLPEPETREHPAQGQDLREYGDAWYRQHRKIIMGGDV